MVSSIIAMSAGAVGGTSGDGIESTTESADIDDNELGIDDENTDVQSNAGADNFGSNSINDGERDDSQLSEEDSTDGESTIEGEGEVDEGSESEDQRVVSNSSETTDGVIGDATQIEEQDNDAVEVAVAVSPPQDDFDGSFASDGTVDIWVGAFTPTDGINEPVANETLNVSIAEPADGQDARGGGGFQVETDSNGSAYVEYDLTDRSDGEYDVTVERAAGDAQTSIQFDAGPVVNIMNNRRSGIFVNEETNVSVLVRNGEFGEADEEVEITVEDPDGAAVLDSTVVTNNEGFVEFSFTPEQTGRHTIDASLIDGDQTVDTDSRSKQATEITLASDFDLREGIFGEETVYGGYLRGADGQLGDTEFTITFATDPSGGDREVIAEENVTTDEHGFFLVPFEAPDDLDADLEIEAETTDGTPIHVRFDRLRLDELPDLDGPEPEPEPEVTLDASVDTGEIAGFGDTTAPGGEVVIDIEAEENGDPIVGEEVDIGFNWDGFGTPPLFATTVTTDEEGETTATMTIPENALDNVRPSGEATLEFDDTVATDSISLRIREHEINTNYNNMVVGETGTFEIEVEDQLTEDSAEGIPAQFTRLHTGYKIDAIDSGELISGADGSDSTPVNVPVDIGPGYLSSNDVHQYRSTGTNRFRIAEHPGTLTVETAADDEDQFRQVAAPGETITVEFDTDSAETASGIVFARAGPRGSFGTEVTSDETATLEIPSWVEDGDSIRLQMWGADDEPPFYEDRARIQIEEPEGAVAAFEIDTPPVGPVVDEELTFDASDSVSTVGNLTYEWDFGDGTELQSDDPVVTHTYTSSEVVTVELTVTDEEGESDTTTQDITVRDATTITGNLTHFDGEAAANSTVLGFDTELETEGEGSAPAGAALTNEDGEFELLVAEPLNETAGDVRIAYYQGNLPEELPEDISDLDAFPRDDRVDLFAVDVVDRDDGPVELGEITVPEGYLVNATVVEEGEPVEDALLLYNHTNEETGAWVDWGERTNEEGLGLTGGTPGFELNGTVDVAAFAPDNIPEPGAVIEPDAFRALEVTEDTAIELELAATPPEAELEAPEEVGLRETFELNASASSDEAGIEEFNFTIVDEDENVVFNQQTPGDDAVVSTNLTESGLYTATVAVQNQDGLTNETSVDILVLDQQPNLVATVDAEDEQRIEDGLNATVNVTNEGDVNITEPVLVEVTAVGSLFETSEVISLNQTIERDDGLAVDEGISEEVTFDTVTKEDERIVGDVDIEVVADPDDVIDEATTATNTDETTVELTFANLIAAANAPNLVVEEADTTFRSLIRNVGTANSTATSATVNVMDEGDNTVFSEEDISIDSLESDELQRDRFNESFGVGEYTLTVDVEDELFPENTTATTTFEVEEYNLSIAEDATDVQAETQVGLNTTVIFGVETNSLEPVSATLDASDVDAINLSDGSETKTVTVDPETDRPNLVAYDVQGVEVADDAELTFTASDTIADVDESEETSETINVTVKTTKVTNESAATLEEDNDDGVEVALEAFADGDTDAQELEVTIQAGTEGRTLQGLGYLVNYPYGCVEQTTSAFLGALNTDEYYDDRDGDVTPGQQDDINGSIEEGIERLQPDGVRGQQDNGSWNQWGREGQSGQSYFSSYALLGVSSVENNDVHSDLNREELDTIDFNSAVEWIADDNWNQPDGYLYDEPASTGFTLVALDETASSDRLDSDAEDTVTEIYADAAVELLESQENVTDGVAWNDENPRSTALAVHGLQLALENEAYEERDDLNETELNETVNDGVAWLLANQNDDGSWDAYDRLPWFNYAGDKSETTSAALMALHETGVNTGNETIEDGTSYLIDIYESDGSWGYPRATQASINTLNELTPGAADRTVDITVDVENGGQETFQDVSVNETEQTSTVTLDDPDLGDILDDTDESEITVDIDPENGGIGTVIIAAQITQDVQDPALGGDDE